MGTAAVEANITRVFQMLSSPTPWLARRKAESKLDDGADKALRRLEGQAIRPPEERRLNFFVWNDLELALWRL